MKQILIISIHSMVDVITNSSSEIFVCNTDKSIEAVKSILKELLEVYNKGTERDLEFNDCFYIENNDGEVVIGSVYDNSIPYSLFDIIEDFFSADRSHLG